MQPPLKSPFIVGECYVEDLVAAKENTDHSERAETSMVT